jgi:hypothetical protein
MQCKIVEVGLGIDTMENGRQSWMYSRRRGMRRRIVIVVEKGSSVVDLNGRFQMWASITSQYRVCT